MSKNVEKTSKRKIKKTPLLVNFPSFNNSFTKSWRNCSQRLKISAQIQITFPCRHLTSVVKWRYKKVEASSSVAIKQYWHLIKITRRIKDSFDVNFGEWSPESEETFSRSASCGRLFYHVSSTTSTKARPTAFSGNLTTISMTQQHGMIFCLHYLSHFSDILQHTF